MEVYSVTKEPYLLSNEAFSVGKCDVFRVTWDKLRYNFLITFCCGGVFRDKRNVFVIKWGVSRVEMRRFCVAFYVKRNLSPKKNVRIQRELLCQTKCISYYEILFVWRTCLSNETYFVCLFSNVVRLFLFVSFQM